MFFIPFLLLFKGGILHVFFVDYFHLLQDLCGLSEVMAKVKHNVIMINNISSIALQYRNGGDGCGHGQCFPCYNFESLLYFR
jgi:hypothetical protein